MDYSASINDADHPAAASPWGSPPRSSPEHSQATFASGIDGGFAGNPGNDANNGPDPERDDEGFAAGAAEETSALLSQEEEDRNGEENQPFASDGREPASSGLGPSNPTPSGANGQQGQGPPHPRKATQSQYKLQAKITGLERTGRKDPILRFDVYTNLPSFRTTQYRDVRRLHSEFVKLAEHLISANPDTIVPAVPPPVSSAGAGTEEDEVRVKGMMQRWFNYVCSNEVLMRDDEMILFVESDFGYSPMVKRKQPATGVRRKILKQFAPPPDDTPELSAARPIVKLFYLGTMDAGHKVDKLVKTRRGLGLAESDFGVKLGTMNVQELHVGLANAYRKLGKVIQTVGDCHAAQATAEATTIGDPFQHHSSDAFIVKETLTNRQILIREFFQAQESSRSKLHAADRLKASSNVKREKVDEAIAALDEARHKEGFLHQKTTRVTQNLVHDQRKWFTRTAADLRLSVREYVVREIEAERRTLALLESVRPDVRAIDASGGLSRLGREHHPTAAVRRASMAASQGPKGDAWSGVPRRSDTLRNSIIGVVPEVDDGTAAEEEAGDQGARVRALSASRAGSVLPGLSEDDEDRVDARNAASRLAASTF